MTCFFSLLLFPYAAHLTDVRRTPPPSDPGGAHCRAPLAATPAPAECPRNPATVDEPEPTSPPPPTAAPGNASLSASADHSDDSLQEPAPADAAHTTEAP